METEFGKRPLVKGKIQSPSYSAHESIYSFLALNMHSRMLDYRNLLLFSVAVSAHAPRDTRLQVFYEIRGKWKDLIVPQVNLSSCDINTLDRKCGKGLLPAILQNRALSNF